MYHGQNVRISIKCTNQETSFICMTPLCFLAEGAIRCYHDHFLVLLFVIRIRFVNKCSTSTSLLFASTVRFYLDFVQYKD